MSDLDRIKKLSGINQVDEGATENMPFMQAIKQYIENKDGDIVFDAGSMIADIQKMLPKEYPDVEIMTIRQDPSTYFKR